MTERKRRMRASRQKRLEHAGFKFEQNAEGMWRVILPITSGLSAEEHKYQRLPKAYKHLTTAVSAGVREIKRVKVLKDAHGKCSEEWETALKLFDTYEPEPLQP